MRIVLVHGGFVNGSGWQGVDRSKFAASFAADVPADQAAFMADSQVPWGVGALTGAVGDPAWKRKPSWYLVATVVEAPGGHAIYVSNAMPVADLIVRAAREFGAI